MTDIYGGALSATSNVDINIDRHARDPNYAINEQGYLKYLNSIDKIDVRDILHDVGDVAATGIKAQEIIGSYATKINLISSIDGSIVKAINSLTQMTS
jgi:hypothetical protein